MKLSEQVRRGSRLEGAMFRSAIANPLQVLFVVNPGLNGISLAQHRRRSSGRNQMAWNALFMRLGANGGAVLDLSIVGYQFPDADDPRKRYSWHMIQGRADTGSEAWDFRWQALTCSEGPRLAAWLREVATVSALATPAEGPGRTLFTEPNLAFEVASYLRDAIAITVELDLEFRAPSNKPNHSVGHPNVLHISTSAAQLVAAAADWESDLLQYPDGLATGN